MSVTKTLKTQLAELLLGSRARKVTVVEPSGKSEPFPKPAGCEVISILGLPALSIALTLVNNTRAVG